MNRFVRQFLFSLLFIALSGCGKRGNTIKTVRSGDFKIRKVAEISDGNFDFKNARYIENSGLFVFTDESSRRLFASSRKGNLKVIFRGNIKKILTAENSGIYFVNKTLSLKPVFELYRLKVDKQKARVIFKSFNEITNLQFVNDSTLLFLVDGEPFKFIPKRNKIEPVKNLKTLGFVVLKYANTLKILGENKKDEFNFSARNRIIWFGGNFKSRIAFAYIAAKGLILFKNGRKIFPGDFEYPEINPSGNLLLGIKSFYKNNHILKSKIILYNISAEKTVADFSKSRSFLTEAHWSSEGNFIVGNDIKGNVILLKIKK